ncbi:hypothetical protein [Lentibacillus salinarum]|uniref:Flavoprotein domain-containing protein n=1 Tax=Lentibacillus salinarum TaxID=446820 RepID=A0ABW3ZQZ2_9BACI
MFHNQQSVVVDSTLQELLNKNKKGKEKAQKKTVLALLFFHMNGMDEGLKTLKVLYENNLRVRICADEHILEHYNVTDLAQQVGIDDWITLEDVEYQKERIDHFYIPILPFSTVSDILHFNDTRPSIRILMWALMNGKKVSALSAGADPYHSIWQQSSLNHGTAFLKHEMKKQLQQIKGFGIQLIENDDDVLRHFITTSQNENKQVVTADMVQKYVEAGQKSIDLEQRVIITPLARDIAMKYQIKIN